MKYLLLLIPVGAFLIGTTMQETATAPSPDTEIICIGDTMENCMTKEAVLTYHAKCKQEVPPPKAFRTKADSHEATFVCDSIFWEYFCVLYPLNDHMCDELPVTTY